MIRMSPAIRMSLGLMFIAMTVLMLGNFIGLIPDQSSLDMKVRKSTAESLAVRFTYAARDNNLTVVKNSLDKIVKTNSDILSLGIRSAYGKYLAQTSDHQVHWIPSGGKESTYTQWKVPLYRNEKHWATLEIRFVPKEGFNVFGYRLTPFTILMVFSAVISFIGFLMYMKKSLRYLDPSSVMPHRVKYALDTLIEGVLLLDTKERIVLANSIFLEKLGYSAKELIGTKPSLLNWVDHKTNNPASTLPWVHTLSEGEKQSGIPLDIHTRSQGMLTFIVNSAPVPDDNGKNRGAVVTFDDVTELEKQSYQLSRMVEMMKTSREEIKNKNKELEILATQDSLTGCLNRRAFFQKAEQYFAQAALNGEILACIMADIDKFKTINDTYGHATGDQVIQFVAGILNSKVRGADIVSRYGGEEFCILLKNCDADNASAVAEKMRKKIAEHDTHSDSQTLDIPISASFGVCDTHSEPRGINELLSKADRALYKAKEEGRNRVVSWNSINEVEHLHKTENV